MIICISPRGFNNTVLLCIYIYIYIFGLYNVNADDGIASVHGGSRWIKPTTFHNNILPLFLNSLVYPNCPFFVIHQLKPIPDIIPLGILLRLIPQIKHIILRSFICALKLIDFITL